MKKMMNCTEALRHILNGGKVRQKGDNLNYFLLIDDCVRCIIDGSVFSVDLDMFNLVHAKAEYEVIE